MKSIADILNAAADLIEPEGAWTQDAAARSAKGWVIVPNTKGAVCWCVWGAIQRAGNERRVADEAFLFFATTTPAPIDWNDAEGRTQAEVVAALRKAAALATQSQGQHHG